MIQISLAITCDSLDRILSAIQFTEKLLLEYLEHDLIVTNFENRQIIKNALDLSVTLSTKITNPKVTTAKSKTNPKEFSQAVLVAISDGKGAFAQALAEQIATSSDPKMNFIVPDYIKNAFAFLGLIEND